MTTQQAVNQTNTIRIEPLSMLFRGLNITQSKTDILEVKLECVNRLISKHLKPIPVRIQHPQTGEAYFLTMPQIFLSKVRNRVLT